MRFSSNYNLKSWLLSSCMTFFPAAICTHSNAASYLLRTSETLSLSIQYWNGSFRILTLNTYASCQVLHCLGNASGTSGKPEAYWFSEAKVWIILATGFLGEDFDVSLGCIWVRPSGLRPQLRYMFRIHHDKTKRFIAVLIRK